MRRGGGGGFLRTFWTFGMCCSSDFLVCYVVIVVGIVWCLKGVSDWRVRWHVILFHATISDF